MIIQSKLEKAEERFKELERLLADPEAMANQGQYQKLAKEYSGKMLIAKVNTDENPQWAMQYGVQGIPTMLLISEGKIVHRQVGALPEPLLREVVTQFMEVVGTKV